jgi:hypothetical protein
MKPAYCTAKVAWEELMAYQLGELPEAREQALEEHYFTCPQCTQRLTLLNELRQGVLGLVREGLVSASVTQALLVRALKQGLNIRSYRVECGEPVACTAGPEDHFVAIRLALPLMPAGAVDIAVHWLALDSDATEERVVRDVPVDQTAGEVLWLFSGEQIRRVPRSRWSMQLMVKQPAGEVNVGPYSLNHTPWEELVEPP